MNYCYLKKDEYICYEGKIFLNDTKASSKVVLTNLNINIITKYKKPLYQQVDVAIYPINEIQILNGIPQIMVNNKEIEIFFDSNLKFSFTSKPELKKFLYIAIEIISGDNPFKYNCKKIKNAINYIDKSLDENPYFVKNLITKKTLSAAIDLIENGLKEIKYFLKK